MARRLRATGESRAEDAWDFEVTGEDGRTFRDHGLRPSDYYAFGAPVVAPGDGEVVRVIDHLEDNPMTVLEAGQRRREAWHSEIRRLT